MSEFTNRLFKFGADPVYRSREIRDGEFDGQETEPPQKNFFCRGIFTVDLDQFGVLSQFVMQTLSRNSILAIEFGFVDLN